MGITALLIYALIVWIAVRVVRRSPDTHVRRGFWRGLYTHWIRPDAIYQTYAATCQQQLDAKRQAAERPELAAKQEIEQQEAAKYRKKVEAERRAAEHARLLAQAVDEGQAHAQRPQTPVLTGYDTNDRLGDAFYQYRAETITLDEYEAAILAEADAIKDRAEELRLNQRDMGKDLYEFERDQLAEDREAVAWRKRWLKDERFRLRNARPGFANSGKWSRFEYVDAAGEVTKRHVVNWEKRGAYIVGYDKGCKEERTFRQDRISDWLAG